MLARRDNSILITDRFRRILIKKSQSREIPIKIQHLKKKPLNKDIIAIYGPPYRRVITSLIEDDETA